MPLRQTLIEVLGAADAQELVGGHQARVFLLAFSDAEPVIAKVLNGGAFDRAAVEHLVGMIAQLAQIDSQVCRPLAHAGALVTSIALEGQPGSLLTCYEYAAGVSVNPLDVDDAARMGCALGRLHQSLRRIPKTKLPVVAALRTDDPSLGSGYQLLHGDFSAGNLRRTDDRLRIFDLDDCGYGPVEFEIANSFYMVLFDAVTGHRPETVRSFVRPFMSSYAATTSMDLDSGVVAHFIGRRIGALGRWLDDLSSAPVGIRNSSPEWLEVLRAFVRDWGQTRRYQEML